MTSAGDGSKRDAAVSQQQHNFASMTYHDNAAVLTTANHQQHTRSQAVSVNEVSNSPQFSTDEPFTLDPNDSAGGTSDSKFCSPTTARPLVPPSQRSLLTTYDSWGDGLDNISASPPRSSVQSPSSPRPQPKGKLIPEDLPPIPRPRRNQ